MRARKHFSLAQANATLPLVRRVVADVVAAHAAARELHAQLESPPAGAVRQNIEQNLERCVDRMHLLVEELTEIGCDLKDYPMGLVDFLGRHQGREICLCWKHGEGDIEFWHELHAGYGGREPISLLRE